MSEEPNYITNFSDLLRQFFRVVNDRLESVGQTLDLVSQLLHVRLLVGHQLLEVERNDGVQHRQHLVCSEHNKILKGSIEEERRIVSPTGYKYHCRARARQGSTVRLNFTTEKMFLWCWNFLKNILHNSNEYKSPWRSGVVGRDHGTD